MKRVADIFSGSKSPLGPNREPRIVRLLERRDASRNRYYLRLGMWLAVLSYMGYGLFDYHLFPDVYPELVARRFGLGLSFLALFELALYRRHRLLVLQLIAAAAIIAGALTWILTARHTNNTYAFALFSVYGAVFILGANLYFRFRLFLSMVVSISITAFYSFVPLSLIELQPWERISLSGFFANCLVLSLYLSWRMDVSRYEKFKNTLAIRDRERRANHRRRELELVAETDSLTGLCNRRAIERLFPSFIEGSYRHDRFVGVMLIDADYFKPFNDLLGHQAGDQCLVRIADTLKDLAQKYDALAGRYGGEEFIFIASSLSGEEGIEAIASDICQTIEGLNIVHPGRPDKRSFITVSVGGAMQCRDADVDLSTLLERADNALYQVKSAGRGHHRFYSGKLIGNENSDFQILRSIEAAIEQRRVNTAYQPIVRVSTGSLFGFEALMRLKDAQDNPISPEFFIPIAERSGDILSLGQWIFENACRDAANGHLASICSINISAEQLRDPAFPLFVMKCINKYRMRPSSIALELTETSEIFHDTIAMEAVANLRSCGLQVWLDDFGTGYSGMHWLRESNFDLLKIDRSYLTAASSESGFSLLEDFVRMAKKRGLQVLIEGVESEEHLNILRRLNVDFAQGYYIGRPESIEYLLEDKLTA